MRRTLNSILTLGLILALSSAQSFAKTMDFPNKGNAMFKITIPDNWEPDSDEDEVVEATSPKNHVQLSIWEIETKEELENLGNDIEDILKDHADEIKLVGEPQKASPGGMDGLLFSGTAVDDDDNHAIEFFALLIVSESKVAMVFIEADADTPKKELEKLQGILKSITPPGGKKVLRANLALDKDSKPVTSFASDSPKIYTYFVGETLKKGDKIKSVWIADDVGDAAPKNTKIDEATVVATAADTEGQFSCSKPTKGWPTGKYHVEILVNDKLVESLKFKITDE